MQNLENTNNASAVDAASGQSKQATPELAHAAPSAAPADDPAAKPAEAPAPAPAKPAAATPVASETKPEPPSTPQPPAPAAPEQPAPVIPTYIAIDDFAKIDLRVAQILVAERVPKADKLLRLEIDLGYEKRQILAGIAQHYDPEKLIGRKIIIVANLAPRKMRGLESNGMLLAASLPPDGAPVLAGFLEDVPLGARLK
jgi:methionyl-tRNA synthetase